MNADPAAVTETILSETAHLGGGNDRKFVAKGDRSGR